jgi:hypothetical protein
LAEGAYARIPREIGVMSNHKPSTATEAGFTQATGGILTVVPGSTVRVATTVTFGYFLNTAKTGFCIVAVNSKGTRAFEYISSLGGQQPTSTFGTGTTLPTACSTTAY